MILFCKSLHYIASVETDDNSNTV